MKKDSFSTFVIFWLSQSVSQLGSAMTAYALTIWAFKTTDSAMTVSLLTFCSTVPYILVSIFVGAYVDRHNKKRIMLLCDLAAVLCTFSVLFIYLSGGLKVYHIYIVNTVIGVMNAFQSPAQSVAVGIMVPKEKYTVASGMNSFSYSLVMILSPMIASFVSSLFGFTAVLAVDIISFFAAFLILLFFISFEDTPKNSEQKGGIFEGIKEGFDYLKSNKGLLYVIISMALINFFSRLTYENILTPMILKRSGGSELCYVIVNGVMGAAGVLGGLVILTGKVKWNCIKMIYYSCFVSFLFGDMSMGFGQSLPVWCFGAVMASFPIPFIDAGMQPLVYKLVPKDMQGRVFAVKNAIQRCAVPPGIILGGFLADKVFCPFMEGASPLASFFKLLVGDSPGAGMGVMFLMTGILGGLSSLFWYKNEHIRKLGIVMEKDL